MLETRELMKALRFRTFLIVVVTLAAALWLASLATPDALCQQSAVPELVVSQEPTQLELMIAGPEAMPLPRKDWRPLFTAVLINHLKDPVVFLPPRNDYYAERWLEWQTADSKDRWLGRQPNHANATCTA